MRRATAPAAVGSALLIERSQISRGPEKVQGPGAVKGVDGVHASPPPRPQYC